MPYKSATVQPSVAITQSSPTGGDAFAALKQLLSVYGLDSLVPTLLQYAQQSYDNETVNTLIQQTPEWKQRFAGNETLKQRGLAVLSPAEYLSAESAYDQVFRSSGLGNLAARDRFADLIGKGVSPSELNSRVQIATQYVNNTDPSALQSLKQYHGLDTDHLVGFVLDTNHSLPFLQQLSNETAVGAEAIRQGLGNDQGIGQRISQYASQGVSQQQAAQGFSQIADMLPREQQLADMYGEQYTQQTAEQEVFQGLASARRARQRINEREQANFSGSGGVGDSLYHPDYALGTNMAGAF